MRDAARATSAAPTYFEPANIPVDKEGSALKEDRALIDGGVFINSPAVSAYVEAVREFPEEKDNICVISLGTGELTRRIDIEEARDWGKAGWALPIIGCIFDGVSDAADYQMSRILNDCSPKDLPKNPRYIRLQGKLNNASDDMDDVKKGNLENLEEIAKALIKSDRFEKIIKLIETP